MKFINKGVWITLKSTEEKRKKAQEKLQKKGMTLSGAIRMCLKKVLNIDI